MRTSFTELVGCREPVQLAAMPNITTPELAVALADAGALAMVGVPLLTPDFLARLLDDLAAATRGVLGVNFLMPFLDRACLEVAATRVRVVEFFYADPDPELVARAHRGGALVSWQVGSAAEAVSAARAGCDFVAAQGTEAGGHVRGTTPRGPLLAEVCRAVEIPVLAAGGIATARDVAESLEHGAAGVRVGTRFCAAAESGAHPRYVEALLAARAEDTVLTTAFSTMWPDAPHRVLRSCVDAARELETEVAGETVVGGQRIPIPRFGVVPPSRETTGHVDAMVLYAGTSVDAVERVQPAAEILRELLAELP